MLQDVSLNGVGELGGGRGAGEGFGATSFCEAFVKCPVALCGGGAEVDGVPSVLTSTLIQNALKLVVTTLTRPRTTVRRGGRRRAGVGRAEIRSGHLALLAIDRVSSLVGQLEEAVVAAVCSAGLDGLAAALNIATNFVEGCWVHVALEGLETAGAAVFVSVLTQSICCQIHRSPTHWRGYCYSVCILEGDLTLPALIHHTSLGPETQLDWASDACAVSAFFLAVRATTGGVRGARGRIVRWAFECFAV